MVGRASPVEVVALHIVVLPLVQGIKQSCARLVVCCHRCTEITLLIVIYDGIRPCRSTIGTHRADLGLWIVAKVCIVARLTSDEFTQISEFGSCRICVVGTTDITTVIVVLEGRIGGKVTHNTSDVRNGKRGRGVNYVAIIVAVVKLKMVTAGKICGHVCSDAADDTAGHGSVTGSAGTGDGAVVGAVFHGLASDITAEAVTDDTSYPVWATGNITIVHALVNLLISWFCQVAMIAAKTDYSTGIDTRRRNITAVMAFDN